MKILKRIFGKDEPKRPVLAAVVGSGAEAERLAAFYSVCPGIELAAGEVEKPGDGIIRVPRIRPPGREQLEEILRMPGLEAMELVVPAESRAQLAAICLKAGLFTSVEPPPTRTEVEELASLARAYRTPLRFRLLPLYYPPYHEFRRLLHEDYVGHPLSLKMITRRGKGTLLPSFLDAGEWIAEHEIGFLSLALWLLGPIAKVHARLQSFPAAGPAASSLMMWKYEQRHLYGFFQLDFCPSLHVRTFTEPVHRSLELTAVGGLLFATRGEGQLLRQPAVLVRSKSFTAALELVPDDWYETYRRLARETTAILRKGKTPLGSAELAAGTLAFIAAARESAARGEEISLSSGAAA